jgi:hypothetical protein
MKVRRFQADDHDPKPESPAEHVRYEAGEMGDPPVASAQMAVRLRAVAAACDGYLRGVFLEIATRIEQRRPVPVPLAKQAGPLGHAILAVQARERDPGEEG